MASILVNFRMDTTIKKQLESICDELGLNLSTAFNMFARKMIREKRIPFELSLDDAKDESQMKAISSFKKIRENAERSKIDWNLVNINKEISSIRKKKHYYGA